ncbi:adenosylcobinamide-GDP ribazoletransferase [Undibacterium sp. Ji22W]|uniref:adenosylcobinamide-GDP ribazoletransferase n=1 Tax=Undibacterium sp. Ji22W TaxID=3413038 RepID=UPI003BF12454
MLNPLRHYLLALQFFTRIPVTGKLAVWVGYSPELLRASAAHFPGIGYLVGACAAFCFWLTVQLLPIHNASSLIAAVLSTVMTAMLTGAFHEDGLADLADGLGGHVSREKSLEIMKDSRIGSYGAIALILALISKLALLNLFGQLSLPSTLMAIFLAHVVSRCMPLFIIRFLPHVGDSPQSKSKPLADAISTSALCFALVWCLCAFALVACFHPAWSWLGGLVGSLLALIWMLNFLKRRLGGFTGDALGATQQLSEIAFYLGVLFAWGFNT